MISIITPTFNRPLTVVERCLTSVDRQTYGDWEHIVVSDGVREEAVAELVKKRPDGKRRYEVVPKQGGFGAAVRQEALKFAGGDYLVFLDDDNIIFPRFLEKMLMGLSPEKVYPASEAHAAELAFQVHPEFVICECLHFGPLQSFFGPAPVVLKGEPKLYHIDTLQIMVKKEAFLKVGWQGNDYFADGRTYEMLGKTYKWINIPEVLCAHL